MGGDHMDDGEFDVSDAALWQRLEDAVGYERGRILEELGDRAERRGDLAEVATLYESAAQAFGELGADADVARNLYWLGRSRRRLGQPDEAMGSFRAASDIFREVGDQSQIAACHDGVGQCLIDSGDADGALTEFMAAERLHYAADNLEYAGRSAMSLGEPLGRSRRLRESLDHFRRARSQFREIGAPHLVVWADDRTAAALIDLGQLPEAIELLRRCQHVAENGGGPRDRAHAAYRLGWTLRLNAEHQEALEHLQHAYELYDGENDMCGKASCDFEAGHAYTGLRNFSEADRLQIRARSVFDALGMDESVDLCDTARAENFRAAGEYEMALAVGKAALARAVEHGNSWAVIAVVTGMASDLLELGRPVEAMELLTHPDYIEPDLGEILQETNERRYVLAAAALAVGDSDRARRLSEEGITELSNTNAVGLLADMHRIHSDVIRSQDAEAANRELAFAVALYLAAGDVRTATRHSARILGPDLSPANSPRVAGPQDELRPTGPFRSQQ